MTSSPASAAREDRASTGTSGALLAGTLAFARHAGPEPEFLRALRAEARAWLEKKGFPKPKDEAWRFTPVSSLLSAAYAPSGRAPLVSGVNAGAPSPSTDQAPDSKLSSELSLKGERRVVLENGEPRLSNDAEPGAVEISSLAAVLAQDPSWLEPYVGKIARISDGFAAQNAALFESGAVVRVKRGQAGNTVHLVRSSVSGKTATLATPRVLVVLEPGSELTLIESDADAVEAPFLDSSVTEIVVGEDARLDHVRVRRGTSLRARLSTVAVRQARGSRYASRVFSFGGAIEREDLSVTFDGEGAECSLDGLSFAGGRDLVDHHTLVDHAVPRCSSRQRYKAILDESGTLVFDGTVAVRHGAFRTAAHQESRNLLLSKDAVVHTKPHLEIDTDDVVCSHGATVGRLDPTELFYLRSRGLDASLARSVLLYAFAREITASVRDAGLRAALEDSVARFLPNGAAAKELA